MCCEFGDAPTTGSTGAAQRKQTTRPTKATRRRYSKVDRNPTNNITWFHRSNRSCV